MEIIGGLVIAIVFYFGTAQSQKPEPKVSEVNQCAAACSTGTMKQYRWCECQGPAWKKEK